MSAAAASSSTTHRLQTLDERMHDLKPSLRGFSILAALKELSPHPQDLNRNQASTALSFGNKYTLCSILGSGISGVVLHAKNAFGQEFAIKIAKEQSTNIDILRESLALDSANLLAPEHTVRKVEMQAHLNLSDCGRGTCCNDRVALVTTYGGCNLCSLYLESPIQITASHFMHLARACMEFWQKLHADHMVLRDIKPENMVLGEDNTLRMIDFHLYGKEGTPENFYLGSRWYRSPTLLLEKLHASEIPFAFGCVLFEILTNRPLFNTQVSERNADDLINTLLHLRAVFKVTGEPSQGFIRSLAPKLRKKLFQLDGRCLWHIQGPLITSEMIEKDHTYIRSKITQAITPESKDHRVLLESAHVEAFTTHFMDLLIKLVNFEHPLSPEEALAHPFFKLPIELAPSVAVEHLLDDKPA